MSYFEFKYIFLTMQLKYNRQQGIGSTIAKLLIKIVLVLLVLIVGILVEKINFSIQKKITKLI